MIFWENCIKKLKASYNLVLMIVIKSEGSSPGKPGFKMAVSGDGDIWGSIGGGNMEFRLVQQCRRMLENNDTEIKILKQDHHPDSKEDNSGMICSGIQWIAFYPIGNHSVNLIKEIITILEDKREDVVVFTEKGIHISKQNADTAYPTSMVTDGRWEYASQSGLKNRLLIFGAGHVSLALSKMAKELDFEVEVFDNRKDINTFEQNRYADKKSVIDYSQAGDFIEEGNHIYVVIMTFAHKSDTTVLKQAIRKKIKYLGMMGSDMKVARVFEELKQAGYTEEELLKADAPIGLPINSITPAEIAVSIMAKIIQVKNS